jgi:hypothetical protein
MAVIRKPAVVKALIIAGSGRCHSVSTQLWPLGLVVSAFLRAEDEDESAGTGRALDRDVEMDLLLNPRPSWPTVAGRKLECQARRELVGGDHDPVIAPVGDDRMR